MTSLSNPTRLAGNFDMSLVNRLGLKPFATPSFDSAFEIKKEKDGYAVRTEVPGFAPDEISVTSKDTMLSIVAENQHRSIKRTILFGDDIDRENIDAKLEYGVLTLTFKRHPEAEPKRIVVR